MATITASPERITAALEATLILLEDEEHWTKGAFARMYPGKVGNRINVDDPEAACWCLDGALRKTTQYDRPAADLSVELYSTSLYQGCRKFLLKAIKRLYPRQRFPYLSVFNDDGAIGHIDILKTLRKAIEFSKN